MLRMAPKRTLDTTFRGSVHKRRKTTLLSLPDEVIVDVLSYLTQSDALSLLYTSKHFERPCYIRLYKDIVICEKQDDAFFRTMVDLQGRTLLSSWPSILSFFSMIFRLVKMGRQPVFLSYLESISSYNYLDAGKVDSYKALSSDDLQNILKLRQMFDPVIESLPNLKSLQLPLIPLEKLQLLKPSILSHLQVLSTTVNMGSNPDNIPYFDNVHTLTINICSREHTTKETINKLLRQCPRLIHLEINGNFGRQDRRLEHTLRHSSLHDDLSPKAQYTRGFIQAVKMEKEGAKLPKLIEQRVEGYAHDSMIDLQPNWYTTDRSINVCPVLDEQLLDGIKHCRLRSFRLRNWVVPTSHDHADYSWLEPLLKESIEHKTLKELDFSNCYVSWRELGDLGVVDLFKRPLFLEYEGLEQLIVGQTEVSDDLTSEGPVEDAFIDQLERFSKEFKSPLKHLKIFGGKEVYFPSLTYYLLAKVRAFQNLRTLAFINFYSQEGVCQRVMACKAMTNYYYTDFSGLDDEMFMLSKELVELMNYTNRVDDYGQERGGREPLFVEKFQREFLYLFGQEVALFFKEIPTLEKFVLYGFPFKRSMF